MLQPGRVPKTRSWFSDMKSCVRGRGRVGVGARVRGSGLGLGLRLGVRGWVQVSG